MANGTPQIGPDKVSLSETGMGNIPPRRKSGPAKKIVLLAVWLALLGGLIFWISSMGGGRTPSAMGSASDKPVPAPVLDTAMLERRWPEIIKHSSAPARGSSAAPYTIAEFGDFQCPQCGKAYPVLETLLKKYPSQVNLLFIHRPFSFHEWAVPAAQASEIAGMQGKFWPMYDILYTSQDNLETGYYSGYAAKAGLDPAKFKASFDAGAGQPEVKAAAAFADSLGVQETPTMLLRDNKAKTVTIYIGTIGTKHADGSPQYPGINALAAQPPWAGR